LGPKREERELGMKSKTQFYIKTSTIHNMEHKLCFGFKEKAGESKEIVHLPRVTLSPPE
jgi:hypothetical protein